MSEPGFIELQKQFKEQARAANLPLSNRAAKRMASACLARSDGRAHIQVLADLDVVVDACGRIRREGMRKKEAVELLATVLKSKTPRWITRHFQELIGSKEQWSTEVLEALMTEVPSTGTLQNKVRHRAGN